jgi:hypothetical protein
VPRSAQQIRGMPLLRATTTVEIKRAEDREEEWARLVKLRFEGCSIGSSKLRGAS